MTRLGLVFGIGRGSAPPPSFGWEVARGGMDLWDARMDVSMLGIHPFVCSFVHLSVAE